MTWGAIFDWDGVIIDSSRHHEESWNRLAQEAGLLLPEGHFKKGFGMKNEVIIPGILNWTHDPARVIEYSLRKEALYREVIAEWGIELLPGVAKLLDALDARGIPRVIGSSTHKLNIITSLEIMGIQDRFDSMVTSEDVSHGKPDPEVFLKAAEKIQIAPQNCVVFEDALVGIEAAHRGGMKAVGVATTNPIELLSHADLAVERLSGLNLDKVAAWFAKP